MYRYKPNHHFSPTSPSPVGVMSSPGSAGVGRVRREHTDDNGALDAIARDAEEKLKAKREARAAARDIRMRELERQERDDSDQKSRQYEQRDAEQRAKHSTATASRKDSADSTDGRDPRRELKICEQRYLQAMSSLAQTDNDRQTYRYHATMLADDLEEAREESTECRRRLVAKTKRSHQLEKANHDLEQQVHFLREQISLRDDLIRDNGLVLVSDETLEADSCDDELVKAKPKLRSEAVGIAALVTPEARQVLGLDGGSLDERLLAFAREKQTLEADLKRSQAELEREREKSALSDRYASPHVRATSTTGVCNGNNDMQVVEMQLEAQKQLSDYRYRLKKSEADITTLDGNVLRLESQVKRYRSAAESSEKNEDDLKQERRRLQRELRDAQTQIEELATANSHLQKRIDKLRSGRVTAAR